MSYYSSCRPDSKSSVFVARANHLQPCLRGGLPENKDESAQLAFTK